MLTSRDFGEIASLSRMPEIVKKKATEDGKSVTVYSQCYNRIMCCTLRCRERFFDTKSDFGDEIGLCVAHMHYGCANKKKTIEEEKLTLNSGID